MSRQEEYEKEAEKLKSIIITPGIYSLKSEPSIKYEVNDINEEENSATIITLKSGMKKRKTLYWCKKRLEKCQQKEEH